MKLSEHVLCWVSLSECLGRTLIHNPICAPDITGQLSSKILVHNIVYW